MPKRWLGAIRSLLAWLLICGVALVVLAQASSLYQVFLVVTMHVTRYTNSLWLNIFYGLAGMLWLGLSILMEHMLMGPEAQAGLLLPRTLFALGIELLLIGLLQVGWLFYAPFGWVGLGLALLELLAGGVLMWVSRRKPRLQKPEDSPQVE
jgi:hypothetical protein